MRMGACSLLEVTGNSQKKEWPHNSQFFPTNSIIGFAGVGANRKPSVLTSAGSKKLYSQGCPVLIIAVDLDSRRKFDMVQDSPHQNLGATERVKPTGSK